MRLILLLISITPFLAHAQRGPEKASFWTVDGPELVETEFSIVSFSQSFFPNEYFICIDGVNPWGQPFGTVFQLTDATLGPRAFLTRVINAQGVLDPQRTLSIDGSNFDHFRRTFVSTKGLHFRSKQPVKFIKIKLSNTSSIAA